MAFLLQRRRLFSALLVVSSTSSTLLALLLWNLPPVSTAFVVATNRHYSLPQCRIPSTATSSTSSTAATSSFSLLYAASASASATNDRKDSKDDKEQNEILLDDDTSLLRTVQKSQLVELCQQFNLSEKGTKLVLLQRLRQHAAEQAKREQEIALQRIDRIEQGEDDPKERHEIVSSDPTDSDDDDDGAFFYFELPDGAINITTSRQQQQDEQKQHQTAKRRRPAASTIHGSVITAPPPPTEPNADGERVVTVYSTSDNNDLTGIAAAQPGQAAQATDNLRNAASEAGPQPWDMQASQTSSSTTTSAELEQATERVTELVQILLAMTGAPAFSSMLEDEELLERIPSFVPTDGVFVGFNPANVPIDLLNTFSSALRTGRGQVLQDVLRNFELQAIGQDGIRGDDVEKGGGHYREVSKVRAFLDGYRRAEVRRLARETSALLLDKLVTEGIEGLDMTLAAMARTNDENSEFAGELNDSLLDYLNDAIRQQEKKVDQLLVEKDSKQPKSKMMEAAATAMGRAMDPVDQLWNITMEDGQQVQSIDPNDPKVQNVLRQEYEKSLEQTQQQQQQGPSIPESAPEKLLLLLTLLRERVKAEAAFSPDEKGRNLRLLAYCLRLASDDEREQLILKHVGNSLDRLDSFEELVMSSIEYGESTSYQLQPAKSISLNVGQLKSIVGLIQSLREKQAWKAAGLATKSRI